MVAYATNRQSEGEYGQNNACLCVSVKQKQWEKLAHCRLLATQNVSSRLALDDAKQAVNQIT